MTTDERASQMISTVLLAWNVSSAMAGQVADDILDDLHAAGIELFETAPAKEASQ